MYVSVLTAKDLKVLDDAFHAALDEAIESNVELSLTALTLRLCDAYLMGERDLEVVADLGLGAAEASILTADLSHAYIDENMRTS